MFCNKIYLIRIIGYFVSQINYKKCYRNDRGQDDIKLSNGEKSNSELKRKAKDDICEKPSQFKRQDDINDICISVTIIN